MWKIGDTQVCRAACLDQLDLALLAPNFLFGPCFICGPSVGRSVCQAPQHVEKNAKGLRMHPTVRQ